MVSLQAPRVVRSRKRLPFGCNKIVEILNCLFPLPPCDQSSVNAILQILNPAAFADARVPNDLCCQTVAVECMLTGEDEELTRQQRVLADITPLAWLNNRISSVERGYATPNMLRRPSRLVHFLLQLVYIVAVILQRGADFFLEVVDHHKVREEGYQIFNLEKLAPA